MYVAGWSQPGCLPEMEPQDFDTMHEAVQWLESEVQRMWDEDQQSLPGEEADAKWLPVHTALHNIGRMQEFNCLSGGLWFWIDRHEVEAEAPADRFADLHTSTIEGAARAERHRAESTGDYIDDRPSPSEL